MRLDIERAEIFAHPLIQLFDSFFHVEIFFIGTKDVVGATVIAFQNKLFRQYIPVNFFCAVPMVQKRNQNFFQALFGEIFSHGEFIGALRDKAICGVVVELEPLNFFRKTLGVIEVQISADKQAVINFRQSLRREEVACQHLHFSAQLVKFRISVHKS